MLSRADDNKTQSTILPSHLAAAVVPAPQLNDNYRPTRWTPSLSSFSASPLVQTLSAPCYTSVAHTYRVITDPFNGPLSGWAGTNLDFTKARDSKWQCYQLGHMQVCTSIQTAHHRSVFLQAGCPSCRPTNSVKALKARPLIVRKSRTTVICLR